MRDVIVVGAGPAGSAVAKRCAEYGLKILILEKRKFIGKVEKKGRKIKKTIEIILKYENKTPAISGLKRISKPGQRVYLPAQKIKTIRRGYGIVIVSTSKGLMTGREARKQKLGGEMTNEQHRTLIGIADALKNLVELIKENKKCLMYQVKK